MLLKALEQESDLHLVGRLMARTEILRSLRNRLELQDLWSRRTQRSSTSRSTARWSSSAWPAQGTSILHELLACDPAHRAPITWELLHPAHGPGEAEAWGDATHAFWHDVQPEYEAMHHNAGDLPNECIFATMNEFLSDHWGGVHEVPSYSMYLAGADHTDAYRYHRRILQTLQARQHGEGWLLKAPQPPGHARRLARRPPRRPHRPCPPGPAEDGALHPEPDGDTEVDTTVATPTRWPRLRCWPGASGHCWTA